MLNAKIFIPRKPILYQTDLSIFLVFLWIHQNPYIYSNYTKWIKICVASRIVHIFQLWRSTIFSLTAVNGYCPTQNVSAINCVECFTSSFFGGKIFYHDKFDLAPLGQCFLKNCWLTVNNIIPRCAFVKMDTYHLLLWLWWNVMCMKKYESENVKVGQNTVVLYWSAVKLHVSQKVLVSLQYDQILCNKKYMINKTEKRKKRISDVLKVQLSHDWMGVVGSESLEW